MKKLAGDSWESCGFIGNEEGVNMEGCVNRRLRDCFVAALLAMTVVSCAPDPRKAAIAFETRVMAEQSVLDAELARELRGAEGVDAQAVRDWEAGVREATTQVAQERAVGFVGVMGWGLTAGCAVVVLGAAWSVTRTVNGMGKALVQFAEVRSSLVHMDRGTRTFPMLRHAHGTRWALAVPSTGSVLMLDEKHEPDRMLIAALGAVCVEGLGVRKVEVIGDR